LPERIPARPTLLRQRAVDHDTDVVLPGVAGFEPATAQERDADGGEIAGRDGE
jgi:hypothetical protein